MVDDGSTDNGPEQVKAYEDSRLRLIRQTNVGPGGARNRGIRESKGKYIAFLDADDEWLPEYLKESYNILESNPCCDICISGWFQDFHGYSCSGEKLFLNKSVIEVCAAHWNFEDGPANALSEKNHDHLLTMWWTSTVLIRRLILSKGYKFYDDSKYTYGEDTYLWIQLAFNHTFYRNKKALAWYHNNNSELADSRGYVKAPLEAFLLFPEEIINNSKKRKRALVRKWLASYAIYYANLRFGVGQHDNSLFLLRKFPEAIVFSPILFFKIIVKILFLKISVCK